ncbi:hypothetical protein [Bacillus atrophaeus]|uniref:Phage protein n=1 Tax=Bacillus atrophaeus (strain 1942) TaxID=720555 RepID=A0ABM5LXP3_BACA1|nr:hypothetical protein [Bacillus atrophaeus]AMR62701.1 hypothetical protein A1D11_09925 [Bacillus subtilis subsp. globigii]ADP32436.1 hypothetical protein BATR1942_07440 [Bacillus atrophaeus 1942]AIK46445.1 hypothetical protein DJ95_1387 [Bacillus atrophaeus subsp. globigii]EIM11765.1 hypothetical protein UY9_05917 [Bacillus atrophaeus C89]KFK84595.1 hypothetical protein DK44_2249 [Bacillus atrophaeus]
MNKSENNIVNYIEKIDKLEEGLSLFEEDDEEYLSILVKIQGLYDNIADAALEGFKDMTTEIRKTGQKKIEKGIDQLPQTIRESVSEQINDMKNVEADLFE